MSKLIVTKRPDNLKLKLLAEGEKLFIDGDSAEKVATKLNDLFLPHFPVTVEEVNVWIRDLHWIRRPLPARGERVTPPLPPKPTVEWEWMWSGWMHEVSP